MIDEELCEAALARIDREEIVRIAAELVRAPSENPGGTEEATVARLAAELQAIGARVELDEVEPGRPNLIARLGHADATGGVLFLGHSDVVPAGPGWTADPFAPQRVGDELIGRGTTDMKGGLAATVVAMAAVHAVDPELPLTLVCTVDEEADARGARHYLATAAPVPYDLCIVAEPTGLATVVGCRGAANLRIEIIGRSAHAGRPSDGTSAIVAAADLIAEVEADAAALARRPHPDLGPATWNVGRIEGGHGTSIVPDRCTLWIDRRLLPGEQPERILTDLVTRARLRISARDPELAERIRFTGEVEMTMPGFWCGADARLAVTACEAVRELGGEGRWEVWTASCEGGFMSAHHGAPTIVLGPGDITGQAHQPNERVRIPELELAAKAYALVALRCVDAAAPEPAAATHDRKDHA